MNTEERIGTLESRQLELQTIMSNSDAHAAKCVKLGLNFGELYPDELEAYKQAREEYNTNEVELAELYAQRDAEEAEIIIHEDNEN